MLNNEDSKVRLLQYWKNGKDISIYAKTDCFFFLDKMETKKSLNTEKGHIIYRQGVMEAKISPNLYENNFSPHIQW